MFQLKIKIVLENGEFIATLSTFLNFANGKMFFLLYMFNSGVSLSGNTDEGKVNPCLSSLPAVLVQYYTTVTGCILGDSEQLCLSVLQVLDSCLLPSCPLASCLLPLFF